MKKVIYVCDLTGLEFSESEVHHFKMTGGQGSEVLPALELCKPDESNIHISKKICSNLNNLFKILASEKQQNE